jgi:hypothetical protein
MQRWLTFCKKYNMANNDKLEQYRQWRKENDPKTIKMLNSSLMFKLFLMGRLPMAFMAGTSVRKMDGTTCQIDVPYKWLNQNPFRSTYFAVLAMAAEMSTGMLAMMMTNGSKPSVSMLVTHLEADFVKKATGITTFTCDEGVQFNEVIERAITTGEAQSYTATAVGKSKDGEIEATFKVEWSLKMRSK